MDSIPLQVVRVRALVVDDYAPTLQSLGPLLSVLGCEVRTCSSPDAAIVMVKEQCPHFAMLDMGLPYKDGFALAGEIRSLCPTAILVAYTGFDGLRDRCRDAGFHRFLLKPSGLRELRSVVELARTTCGLNS